MRISYTPVIIAPMKPAPKTDIESAKVSRTDSPKVLPSAIFSVAMDRE